MIRLLEELREFLGRNPDEEVDTRNSVSVTLEPSEKDTWVRVEKGIVSKTKVPIRL